MTQPAAPGLTRYVPYFLLVLVVAWTATAASVPPAVFPGTPDDGPPDETPAGHGSAKDATPSPHGNTGTSCDAAGSNATAPAGLPGTFESSAAHFTSVNRSVDADENTTWIVMALQQVLVEPAKWEDVVSFEEERVEVCVIDRALALDRGGVMSVIALGASPEAAELRDLVGEEHVMFVTRTTTSQEVHVDEDVALAALTLGGPVRLEEVADIRRSTERVRTVEHVADYEREDVLAAMALARDAGPDED